MISENENKLIIKTIKTIDFPLTEPVNSYIVKLSHQDSAYLIDAGAVENPPVHEAVRSIIITHWHWDHTLGLVGLSNKVSTVYMSKATYKMLARGGFEECFSLVVRAGGIEESPETIMIKQIFNKRYNKISKILNNYNVLDIRELDIGKVIECPGHTRDHICLIMGRGVFTGDTIIPGTRPTVIDSLSHRESLVRVLGAEWELLYPGHGEIMERQDVVGYVNWLINNRNKKLLKIIKIISKRGEVSFSNILREIYGAEPSIAYFVQMRTLVGYIFELEKYNLVKIDKMESPWTISIVDSNI